MSNDVYRLKCNKQNITTNGKRQHACILFNVINMNIKHTGVVLMMGF